MSYFPSHVFICFPAAAEAPSLVGYLMIRNRIFTIFAMVLSIEKYQGV